MNSPHPRVSIGVPVYNGEAFLEQTLDGLLAQSFSDFEILISDNGSTDRTQEICRAYAGRDPRIRYYRHEQNRGAAWNHNNLVEHARGELFKWNSADDVCAPEFLSRCVAALDHDPAAVLACANVLEIDEAGDALRDRPIPSEVAEPLAVKRFARHVQLDHLCIHVYGVMRASALRQTDLIGSYTDSDRVLLAHLALLGRFVIVPDTLLFNRHHSTRSTEAYVGWRSRTVWFDPTAATRRLFPFWTEFFGFWNVVSRNSLPFVDRFRCYAIMVKWMWEYKKYLLYEDLAYYPRQWVVTRVPGAKKAWTWLKQSGPRIGLRSAK
jgi:glycosyltransferase involved in cell wall biosynthesis